MLTLSTRESRFLKTDFVARRGALEIRVKPVNKEPRPSDDSWHNEPHSIMISGTAMSELIISLNLIYPNEPKSHDIMKGKFQKYTQNFSKFQTSRNHTQFVWSWVYAKIFPDFLKLHHQFQTNSNNFDITL